MMNRAIAMLNHEHLVIMKVVDALGAISNDLAHGKAVETETLRGIVKFMHEFADKCHHAKEESILFPAMAKHGVPESGCPLSALRHEHIQGRQFVAALAEATEAYARRDANVADRLMTAIANIGHLYPSHIWKEDNMVFPMVDRLFSPEDIEQLAEQFEQTEAELSGEAHEKLERFAEGLPRRTPEFMGT